MTYRKEYPTELADCAPGRPFFMLNYDGLFMRVFANGLRAYRGVDPLASDFNDMGYHYPIVNLTTGELTHMHKTKPCRVY